eukprot:UN24526
MIIMFSITSPPPPGLPPFHPPRKKPKVTSTWTSKSYNRTRDRGISDSANIDLDLSLGRIDPEECKPHDNEKQSNFDSYLR